MKTKRRSFLGSLPALMAFVMLSGCSQMSERIEDKTAGMNGSFENVQSGLPVNWIFYTPKTVPKGDFDILIDTTGPQDGKQSLKFVVRQCSPDGGWHSPGFCNELKANPGETYKVSFWVKNIGSTFFVHVGGVSAFKGQYDTIVKSNETIDKWQLFEARCTVAEKMNAIRFELNLLSPGTFWIDDIRIEKE